MVSQSTVVNNLVFHKDMCIDINFAFPENDATLRYFERQLVSKSERIVEIPLFSI